jgi:hypothetical protein
MTAVVTAQTATVAARALVAAKDAEASALAATEQAALDAAAGIFTAAFEVAQGVVGYWEANDDYQLQSQALQAANAAFAALLPDYQPPV